MPQKTKAGYGVVEQKDSRDISYTDSNMTGTQYFTGKDISIKDGVGSTINSFNVAKDVEGKNITYTRTFSNNTFNPWFVPFDINVSDAPEGVSFYKIYNVASDNPEDNAWYLSVRRVKAGVIPANVPYLVKPANANVEYTFTVNNGTLYSIDSEVRPQKNIDCSSTEEKFDFIGIYATKTPTADDCDWYVMTDEAQFSKRTADSKGLKPFRFYLNITTRNAAKPVRLKVKSMDDSATGINQVDADQDTDNNIIFDLQGRKVSKPGKGVYIVNGKKLIFK